MEASNKPTKSISLSLLALGSLALCSASFFFSSPSTSATTTAIDDVNITIPLSCTMTLTEDVNDPHTATVLPGYYTADIGTSTVKTVCNDPEGFAIYAVGYTNDTVGNTTMLGTLGSGYAIPTGLHAQNSTASSWAFKLTAVNGTYPITINSDTAGSFSAYHVIPSSYTKVAYRESSTDADTNAEGSSFTNTFDFYAAPNQVADSYEGVVKFVLVHPSTALQPAAHLYYDANGGTGAPASQAGTATQTAGTYTYTLSSTAPTKEGYAFRGWATDPAATTAEYQPGDTLTTNDFTVLYAVWRIPVTATLDTGQNVNQKLKRVANNDNSIAYSATDYAIYAISRAHALPNDFTPSSDNTISLSTTPVYIWFDSTANGGTIYYYSDADIIYLNQDSSYLFYRINRLGSFGDVASLNASNVQNASYMFENAGFNATTAISLDLTSWDMSSVTNMNRMFYQLGRNASSVSLDLSGWDTSSVASMDTLFYYAGYSSTNSFTVDLSGWDVSGVTSLANMFYFAGEQATTFAVDISGWDTTGVTSITSMFDHAGMSATDWSITGLADWDTASVEYMTNTFDCAAMSASSVALDISGWDTSSVVNTQAMLRNYGYSVTGPVSLDLSGWDMSNARIIIDMFNSLGHSASSVSLDVSGWDTHNVTNMNSAFSNVGINATTLSIDLSGWNTSSVNYMNSVFASTAPNATSWTVTIPATNGAAVSPISNTTSLMYGKNTSVNTAPPSGKSFTLATP